MNGHIISGVIGLVIGGAAAFGYLNYTSAPPPAPMAETMPAETVPAETMAAVTAEEAYQHRNAVMKGIGGHMQALGAVAKGEAEPDAGTIVHARGLNAASQAVKLLFVQEGISEKSRSKPEIWSDWAGFSKAADDFAMATAAVVPAAESGDPAAIGAALGEVGKTCGGCHQPYRGPEK